MISTQLSRKSDPTPIGISAVSTFQPPWILPNEWFETMARKFVNHTGILQRPVAVQDEVGLAIKATENLVRDTACDLRKCAGLVFTSPSFVPMMVARKYMSAERAEQEQLDLPLRHRASPWVEGGAVAEICELGRDAP